MAAIEKPIFIQLARSLRPVPTNTAAYADKCRSEPCRNCVRSPRKRRQIPTFTGSRREACCGGKSLSRFVRRGVSVLLSAARRNRFPSVLLHPPPLACAVRASYGEMSRRSGFAAEADNHSDIAPLASTVCQRSETRLANSPRLPIVSRSHFDSAVYARG
jgi:hypothetical protein